MTPIDIFIDCHFAAIFMNDKRFIVLKTEDRPTVTFKVGDLLNLFEGSSKAIKRVVTYVEPRDVLLAGDEKEIFLSIRPLSNIEKDQLKSGVI